MLLATNHVGIESHRHIQPFSSIDIAPITEIQNIIMFIDNALIRAFKI